MVYDRQKSKVYEAEAVLRTPFCKCFKSLTQMQDYVDKILLSEWWKGRSQCSSITVKLARKDSGKAYYQGTHRNSTSGIIVIPPTWGATDAVLVHELAHAMTHKNCESHGATFCRNFIDLTGEFIGKVTAKELEKSFKEKNCDVAILL